MNGAERVKLVRDEEGEGVVLDTRDSRYYQLNSTAAEILEHLLRGEPPSQLAAEWKARFPDVDPARIQQDIDTWAASFAERGWIEGP